MAARAVVMAEAVTAEAAMGAAKVAVAKQAALVGGGGM